MKYIIFLLLISKISYSQWKIVDIVDDFGKKTGEKREIFEGKGTFKNIENINFPMTIKLRLSKNDDDGDKYKSYESYYFWTDSLIMANDPSQRNKILNNNFLKKDYEKQKLLYENRLGQLWFTIYDNFNRAITFNSLNRIIITLKLNDGTEIYWVDDIKLSTIRYWTFFGKKNSDSAKVYLAITDPNPVEVEISHGGSKYYFKIDGYNKKITESRY